MDLLLKKDTLDSSLWNLIVVLLEKNYLSIAPSMTSSFIEFQGSKNFP